MKRQFYYLGIITLLSFIMTACGTQTDRSDTRENMAELKEDMQEVIKSIDEALATNDISEFKNKTDDAISSLDNKIDDYLDEMDNAERKIDQSSRNHVIKMKQKKVEVEFKLALLEQDDYNNRDTDTYQQERTGLTTQSTSGTATGIMVGDGRTGIDGRDQTRTGIAGRDQTRTGVDGKDQKLTDIDRKDQTRTGIDGRDQTRTGVDGRSQRNIIYGPELIADMKNDLRDLKSEVEQFMQVNLTSR